MDNNSCCFGIDNKEQTPGGSTFQEKKSFQFETLRKGVTFKEKEWHLSWGIGKVSLEPGRKFSKINRSVF